MARLASVRDAIRPRRTSSVSRRCVFFEPRFEPCVQLFEDFETVLFVYGRSALELRVSPFLNSAPVGTLGCSVHHLIMTKDGGMGRL